MRTLDLLSIVNTQPSHTCSFLYLRFQKSRTTFFFRLYIHNHPNHHENCESANTSRNARRKNEVVLDDRVCNNTALVTCSTLNNTRSTPSSKNSSLTPSPSSFSSSPSSFSSSPT